MYRCTLIAMLIAIPATAQDHAALCRDLKTRRATVGHWASYAWQGGRAEGTAMRVAIVGTEKVGDSTFYWYEVRVTTREPGDAGRVIMQALVPGLVYDAAGMRALVIKSGKDPATRLPDEMVRMMAGRTVNMAAEMTRACLEADLVGWEQVTVPAGAFRALHAKTKEGAEAWYTPELLFGLLKVVTKEGDTMVLTGRGTDAKSSITETPRSLGAPKN